MKRCDRVEPSIKCTYLSKLLTAWSGFGSGSPQTATIEVKRSVMKQKHLISHQLDDVMKTKRVVQTPQNKEQKKNCS